MKEKIKEFVVNYVEKKGKLPANVHIDTFNYVDTGYVDSMGIIKFVVELEKEFDIEITDDDIMNSEFKIIGGLVKIIESKLK